MSDESQQNVISNGGTKCKSVVVSFATLKILSLSLLNYFSAAIK